MIFRLFDIENKMVCIIITPSLYYAIPDCLSKQFVLKRWAPVVTPASSPGNAQVLKPYPLMLIADWSKSLTEKRGRGTCVFVAFPLTILYYLI